MRRVHKLIAAARAQGRDLLEHEALALLREYGIPIPAHQFLAGADADAAAEAARAIGMPVAVKIVSKDIVHKSDVGGVETGLDTEAAVRAACWRILERVALGAPKAEIAGLLVVKQALPGLECVAGMTRDPQFGTALMFGLGGVFVEALDDVALQLLPVDRDEALEMTRGIRGARLLDGYRGAGPLDRPAAAELICRLGALAEAEPELAEIDVNPFFLYPQGLLPVDVRMLLKK